METKFKTFFASIFAIVLILFFVRELEGNLTTNPPEAEEIFKKRNTNVTTTSSSTSSRDSVIYVDFFKPYTLNMDGSQENGKVYHFRVNESILFLEDLKMAMVVEKMTCAITPDSNYSYLLIKGDSRPPQSVCFMGDESRTNFQHVKYYFGGHKAIEVVADGDWSISSARMTFTVYSERQNCVQCMNMGAFCCTPGCKNRRRSRDLEYNTYLTQTDELIEGGQEERSLEAVRCISFQAKCNSRANCGYSCNLDESEEICDPNPDPDPCIGFSCGGLSDVTFIWILVISIVIILLTPTVIFFIICYFKAGRILRRQQMGNYENAQNTSSATSSSPSNEPCPSYEEVHDTKDPPPCFCRAIRMSISSESHPTLEGIENPGFTLSVENLKDLEDPPGSSRDSRTLQISKDLLRISQAESECSCKKGRRLRKIAEVFDREPMGVEENKIDV